MLELAQRLGLDLADALAGHREPLADFFQRVIGVHGDAKAHAQHTLLARRERGEHPRRGLARLHQSYSARVILPHVLIDVGRESLPFLG